MLATELGSGKPDPARRPPGSWYARFLPCPWGSFRPIARGDSGFFDAKVVWAALATGADVVVAIKRNRAVWRAERKVAEDAWQKAIGMNAGVAECDFAPAGWPPGTRTICRRVELTADEVRTMPAAVAVARSTPNSSACSKPVRPGPATRTAS